MLVIQADSASTLPSSWVVNWVADSAGIRWIAVDSLFACFADTAKVDSIWGPLTPADSAANVSTAHFCSASAASIAYYVLDLTGGSGGKLKVVMLDPADSTHVIESNEVTYNESVEGEYGPIILRATSVHRYGDLTVTVVGTGLGATQGVSIAAKDGLWTFPLTMTSRSDSLLTAGGTLAAPLPECTVEATTDGKTIATTSLGADSFPPFEPESSSSYFNASLDTAGMLAKDFAFVNAGDSWHIFYTRQYTTGYNEHENQRAIGHAVSTDRNLSTWTVVDRSAIRSRDGHIFDNLHVWAPNIFRKPGDITYYMFYAGVELDTISVPPNLKRSQIQRLGVATSTDLIHWTQDPDPIYWNRMALWTYQDSTHSLTDIGGGDFYSDAWQFRDPFVMPDPDNPGRYLLYFVAIDSCARIAGSGGCASQFLVGVARTPAGDPGNLRKWADVGPLLRTSQSHVAANRIESPTALSRGGNFWLMYTANRTYGDQLTFTYNPHPASLDTSAWVRPDSLKAITCQQHNFPSTLNLWHAPEALNFATNQYLMAWSDDLFNGGTIQFSQIRPPDGTCPTDSFQLVTPDMVTGIAPEPSSTVTSPVSLALAGASPAHSTARLVLSLARPMEVHVAVYDVSGRRVRTLLRGVVPAGSRQVIWDTHSEQGAPVGSGIYFVRATWTVGRQVVRVPLIH